MAKKKVVKKKIAKKESVVQEESKQEVPQSIRERAARNAKKKAEMDKEQKAKEKVIPEGALETLIEASRSAARRTTGNEKDKFTWIDILSNEVMKLSVQYRELKHKMEAMENGK